MGCCGSGAPLLALLIPRRSSRGFAQNAPSRPAVRIGPFRSWPSRRHRVRCAPSSAAASRSPAAPWRSSLGRICVAQSACGAGRWGVQSRIMHRGINMLRIYLSARSWEEALVAGIWTRLYDLAGCLVELRRIGSGPRTSVFSAPGRPHRAAAGTIRRHVLHRLLRRLRASPVAGIACC